ncbi:MAG: hypothetical protein FE048_00820 [Thermoplasmata archaeon]|nr:MAG: hypothetical protein FE048_00820 [Thermoplasmata archaeon]
MKDEKEYEFEFPAFDEKEFKEKEKRKAKTSFISFGFGIFMGIISHFAWASMPSSLRWGLTFLLAICSIGFLAKLLQLLKIDISKFEKKDWFGSISFYFFTWLAIFIISINPPFYDASPPKIDAVALPGIQEVGGNILIAARVTDNVKVKEVKVNISDGQNWNIFEMQKEGDVYTYTYQENKSISLSYVIIARDKSGREARKEGRIEFAKGIISITNPTNKGINATYTIEIQVAKNISNEKFRCYLEVDGKEINATLSGNKTIGGIQYRLYTTSPAYEGWKENLNVNVKACAEVIHYFPGIEKKYNNTVKSETYTFKTVSDSAIGKKESPLIKGLPHPTELRQVPGFEILLLIAAFLILFSFRKRK